MAQQPKRFGSHEVECASIAYFRGVGGWGGLRNYCGSTWLLPEETLYVPVVTRCIIVLKHTVKYIRCEVFVMVVATVCYSW